MQAPMVPADKVAGARLLLRRRMQSSLKGLSNATAAVLFIRRRKVAVEVVEVSGLSLQRWSVMAAFRRSAARTFGGEPGVLAGFDSMFSRTTSLGKLKVIRLKASSPSSSPRRAKVFS